MSFNSGSIKNSDFYLSSSDRSSKVHWAKFDSIPNWFVILCKIRLQLPLIDINKLQIKGMTIVTAISDVKKYQQFARILAPVLILSSSIVFLAKKKNQQTILSGNSRNRTRIKHVLFNPAFFFDQKKICKKRWVTQNRFVQTKTLKDSFALYIHFERVSLLLIQGSTDRSIDRDSQLNSIDRRWCKEKRLYFVNADVFSHPRPAISRRQFRDSHKFFLFPYQ